MQLGSKDTGYEDLQQRYLELEKKYKDALSQHQVFKNKTLK